MAGVGGANLSGLDVGAGYAAGGWLGPLARAWALPESLLPAGRLPRRLLLHRLHRCAPLRY